MQVVCERSNTGNDVRCDICGQGFVVHWSRMLPALRREARLRIAHALRRQHRDESSSHQAHAETHFTVNAASPAPSFSGAAEMANAGA